MNPVVLGEEQTRTIKYLNKRNEIEEQHSADLTEKHYQQELLPTRKKHPPRLKAPLLFGETQTTRSKVVVVQSLQQPAPQQHTTKRKHKKGKSVEIEQGHQTSREERHGECGMGEAQSRGTVVINSEMLLNYRERGSISQMKQYNLSKKLNAPKKSKDENSTQPKRNKAKSINQGEIRQIKREIKSIIDASPLHLNFSKKKEMSKSSSKSSKTNSNPLIQKPIKHKSHQLNTDRRLQSTKNKNAISGIKNIAYTMPITSKMVSLYSNNSSLFSSKAELQKVDRRHSYIIPTEQSIAEMPQIRKYQSFSLRKRSSGDLRKGKVRLINQLSQDEQKQSTANIIHNYLELLRSHQLQFGKQVSSELQISAIPHQDSYKQRHEEPNSEVFNSLNFVQTGVIWEQSIMVQPLSKEINQQQEQLSKLNQIIHTIKQRGSIQQLDKRVILQKIKGLIPNSSQQIHAQLSPLNLPPALPKEQTIELPQSKQDLNSSELKESLIIEQSMERLNLQILDKTLRQRESYLLQRKERELQRLQEKCVIRDQAWLKEKERIEKWMGHQIRQVVHTRRQLWKGFSIAKTLLQHGPKQERKNEMIRCLSDKYLTKSRRKKKQNTQLSRGRVNEIGSHSDQHSSSSSVNIQIQKDQDDEVSEEQLLNSNCLQKQFEQYKKSLPGYQQAKVEFENEIQSESVDGSPQNKKKLEQSPLLQPPSIGVPSVGLSLQKIECQMDYEDSLNSQELDAMSRESEQAKADSFKLPFSLSVQDKEDIFQFIFLDLCIELTEQYAPETKVMRKIDDFIRTMKDQARKQKGFKTNTNAIRDYLFQFITYLKNKPDQLAQVHQNIEKPLGPTALDILRYMHVYDDEPEDEGADTVFIMEIKLFEGFQQTFLAGVEFEKYYEDEEKEKKRKIFLKNAIHIHNKAIFDALNETLDRERPFGVWGEPFSWKKSAKFYHVRDVAAKNSLILKSAQRTIEYGAYMCGFIADKEDCQLRNNPNLTQAYIDQIRDDRLSRLLANELDQSEEKMLFIDDEQTQILVEVAQSMLQQLLNEACRELF